MSRVASTWAVLAASALAAGCDVPAPPGSTGGVDAPASACGHGLVVLSSDYTSTSVGVLAPDGAVLSAAIIGSGARAPGVVAPLSGDVVAPHEAPASGKIVLIDRYPGAVVTWLDPRTASVTGQLSVATGFASNPQDYVEVSPSRAYVSRYESNPAPGAQPFDAGGDVLVVSLDPPAITGRIALDSDGAWLPRPARMARIGRDVVVSLQRFAADFSTAGDAELVGLDVATDSVAWRLALPGLASCGALVAAPSGAVGAVACSGVFRDGEVEQLDRSAIVVLDLAKRPPVEIARHLASSLAAPFAPSVGFASDDVLLGTTYGRVDAPTRPDRAFSLSLASGRLHELAAASTGFVLGDVRCVPACAARCYLADAERRGVRRLSFAGEDLAADDLVALGDDTGLPPRYLGGF